MIVTRFQAAVFNQPGSPYSLLLRRREPWEHVFCPGHRAPDISCFLASGRMLRYRPRAEDVGHYEDLNNIGNRT